MESPEPWPRRALGFGGVRHSSAGNYGWKKAGAAREPAAFHLHPTGRRLPLAILIPPDQGEAFPPPALDAGGPGVARAWWCSCGA